MPLISVRPYSSTGQVAADAGAGCGTSVCVTLGCAESAIVGAPCAEVLSGCTPMDEGAVTGAAVVVSRGACAGGCAVPVPLPACGRAATTTALAASSPAASPNLVNRERLAGCVMACPERVSR